ncbi:bifunctional helix-turn-helix domain-containing protein/methylated-DNA--[protein]-cysteine S-methyltransferase [Leptospira sp. 96542]|nr:bifunctional helix-turn-helix domain-containing protein/methylated-DNA--[protein]-cysteine S-methyltransferase [Leptospira sp. 96542]
MKGNSHFDIVKSAIEYIQNHSLEKPNLETMAEVLGMSPFHFQRIFSEWAGVSPKTFLQYTTHSYAKKILTEHSILDTSLELGLSGPSRLHDLFIKIEAMTPGEYKQGGRGLNLVYEWMETPFGKIILVSTEKGVSLLEFVDGEEDFSEIRNKFPNADWTKGTRNFHRDVLDFFNQSKDSLDTIRLHLLGTPFQIKIWETLLKIPEAKLMSYSQVANSVNKPNAQRAVGSAIAKNPVAYLIPCHRVIQSSGVFGEYHWDKNRKLTMIGWEANKQNSYIQNH